MSHAPSGQVLTSRETNNHEHIRYGDWPRCGGGLHDRSQLAAAQEGADYRAMKFRLDRCLRRVGPN
jgi:hypothetical protein